MRKVNKNDDILVVTFDVFGVYTHGKHKGKTNPKSVVTVTMFGNNVGECVSRLNKITSDAMHKIVSVSDNVEAIRYV